MLNARETLKVGGIVNIVPSELPSSSLGGSESDFPPMAPDNTYGLKPGSYKVGL
jgi:hypothetical protein